MRTFTFSDATSHKFWNIDLTGTSFTVTYGKIGTKGQTQTKEFPTEEKALKEYEKLVKEKVSKGYVETTSRSVKSPKQLLEESLVKDPSDRATHAAYADLLIEEGDPRGEFIQVQLRLEDESLDKGERSKLKKREKELQDDHLRTWLGPLASIFLDFEGVKDWRKQGLLYLFEKGLLRELRFGGFGVRDARALTRATEETRFLHTLRIDETPYEDAGDYDPGPDLPEDDDAGDYPSINLLARWKNLASLHVFQFGELDDEDYQNCHVEGEKAHHLVKQMPLLEELYLLAHRVDGSKLFALPMPNLRILRVDHSDRYPLRKLAENPSLTKLEQMLFHPHAVEEEMPYGLPELKAVVNSPHLKSLTQLRMRMTIMGDPAIKAIVDSGILKRLKVLDLAMGTVSDDGAEMLANCPDAKNLSFLNLNFNELTEKGIQSLKTLGIKIDVVNQHESTAGLDDDEKISQEFLFFGDIE